jgi:ABC-type sugar transport system substrate-binding protein
MRDRGFRYVVLALLSVIGATLVASGCGSSDSSGTSDSSGGTELAGKKVVLLSCAASNPWCKTFNEGIVDGLEAEGVDVELLENNFDTAVQTQQFNQAIAKNPDLILLEATDSKSVVPSILKADQAGVPVINLDGRAEDAAQDALAGEILADNPLLGKYAAENVIDGLKAAGVDHGNVIAITGTEASTITEDRMEGFNEVMDTAPEYKVVAVEDGNWDPVASGKIAQELFAKYRSHGGIQAAYGMADYQAVPIIQAAKQAGIKVGAEDGGLVVTGSNCTKSGIEAIRKGEMFGTATEDPVNQGQDTAKEAIQFLKGEDIGTVLTPQARVRADNVEDYAADCSKS